MSTYQNSLKQNETCFEIFETLKDKFKNRNVKKIVPIRNFPKQQKIQICYVLSEDFIQQIVLPSINAIDNVWLYILKKKE